MFKFALCSILILTSFAAPGSPMADDENEKAISGKMTELAGEGAAACGLLKRGQDLSAPWQCAQSSDASGVPFWLALEGRRTDSAIWFIVARATTGKRYVFFYTSNNYGQPEFQPHFSETECNEPFELHPDEGFVLTCGPDIP